MGQILLTAGTLDISGWLRGIIGAGISGGSSSVTGGTVVSLIDPADFNMHTGKFYALIFSLFAANALVSIFKFLSSEPLPIFKTVTTATETVSKKGATVVKSIESETHTEPLEPKV